MSEKGGFRSDLRKRGERQMQQLMQRMMSNPDFMKAAGSAMTLLSRINEVRSKGVKPLDEMLKEIDRQVERLQKKANSIASRVSEIEAKMSGGAGSSA